MRTTQSLGLTGVGLWGDVPLRESATRLGDEDAGMTRFLLLLGLMLCLATSDASAQTATTPSGPLQSLRPSQSACGPGSQSVRVCNDDFRSCSSVCNAQTLDPTFDTTGCGLKCCNQFKACLSIRGCATLTLNCF
jgi:hypothetical protein